jgi:flavin reductase (DIM6/NTAB) family NADH-FMN oxidoreductase RutF
MSDSFALSAAGESIDEKTFWRVLGERASAVAIVTAADDNGPAGFLALSATHVTATPPTMLVSIDRRTSALATVEKAGHFAINYVARGSGPLADLFAGKTGIKGAERFQTEKWITLSTGAPILQSALGAVDCRLEKTVDLDGTVIAIGRVVSCAGRGSSDPLIFFRGRYHGLGA